MLFDSHVHLDSESYDSDRDEVIARAVAAGVTQFLCIGASDGILSAERAVNLSTAPNIWASVGIHPHDAGKPLRVSDLSRHLDNKKVVAIGETGLDYFKDWAPRNLQDIFFREHIRMARVAKKPLIIHCREAADDCLRILQEENAEEVGGVFHCFAEDAVFAEKIFKLNFLVSFPGVLTFKKSIHTREAAKKIPIERILLETDGPFLSPEPYRSKRCESAFMVETARVLADLKGLSLTEVATITTENTRRLFKI